MKTIIAGNFVAQATFLRRRMGLSEYDTLIVTPATLERLRGYEGMRVVAAGPLDSFNGAAISQLKRAAGTLGQPGLIEGFDHV